MSEGKLFVSGSWQIDLGPGRRMEYEIDSAGDVWSSASANISRVDVWMEGVGELVDLRVRIERVERGLCVIVDRGDNQGEWWHGGSAPRLLVRISAGRTAEIRTSIGEVGRSADAAKPAKISEFVLGQTAIEDPS